MSSVLTPIAEFLGLKRNVALLLIAIVGIGLGEELWMRFVPKYLEALGAAVWVIGLYDAIKTWLGAIYAYPGGVLTDRWGHRRALTFFTLLSICGYGVILLVPHWAGLLAASFLFLAWSSFSLPATFSVIGNSLASNKYAMGIGVQATMKRIPIILGPILGGVLMDHYGLISGTKAGVVLAICLAALAIVFQQQIREGPRPGQSTGTLSLSQALQELNPALRRLLLSDILVRFCERIPYAWVVIYSMNYIHINATEFGLLTAIEMATAIACFIPMAHLSDKHGREPFIVATFVFFTLFPIFLLYSRSYSWLILAFVVRGLKEFGEPARKALIIGLNPEPNRAQTIGAYYLIRDSVVTPGALLGALLWRISPQANFLGAALAGSLGTLYYVASGRSKDRRKQ
jgi:MFS family permease